MRKKIRVAYIINRIERGGPGYIVLNLIETIDRKEFTPVLITLFDENDNTVADRLRANGIQIAECRFSSRLRFLLTDYEHLARVLEKKFDVVHTHGFIPDLAVSRMRGIPRRVTTVHNVMKEDYAFCFGNLKGKLLDCLHRSALRKYDAVIGCSRTVKESLRGIPNAGFIRNGISIREEKTAERSQIGVPDGANVFFYAGKISIRKNVTELVQLFSACHGADDYLIIAGNGPEIDKCKSIFDNHIKYLGYQDDVIPYMQMADVYISASKSEGFSVSVLEALNCGLMLFLSEIKAHREVFEMAEGIYLGEMFDADNFAEKMRLLKKHRTSRESIKRFYAKKLSAEVMADGYQRVYRHSSI